MKKGLFIGFLSGMVMFFIGLFVACSLQTNKTGGEGASGDIISPFAYGNINGDGTLNTTSGNFTVTNSITGTYQITWNSGASETYYTNVMLSISFLNSGGLSIAKWTSFSGGKGLYIYVYDVSGTNKNAPFSFIVYRP